LHLDDFWAHKDWLILKFAGVDSITEAETLLGAEIQIPRSQRAELEPGAAYVVEIVGSRVIVTGPAAGGTARELGAVVDVQFGAGEAPLLIVRGPAKREFMIPLAQEFVRRMDLVAHVIELELPTGMLDLDAPLSAEEKERQKGK
jgi:16S rRNA processing protein RimM